MVQGLRISEREVCDQKTLHPRALDQEMTLGPRTPVPRSPAWIGSGSADHDPGTYVQMAQHSVADRPGGVVEIDIDARGARITNGRIEVRYAFVVDRGRVPELLDTL